MTDLPNTILNYFTFNDVIPEIKYYTRYSRNLLSDFILGRTVKDVDEMKSVCHLLDERRINNNGKLATDAVMKKTRLNDKGFFALKVIQCVKRNAVTNEFFNYSEFVQEPLHNKKKPTLILILGFFIYENLPYSVSFMLSTKEDFLAKNSTDNVLNPLLFYRTDFGMDKITQFINMNRDYFYAYLFIRNLRRAIPCVPSVIHNKITKKINDLFDIDLKKSDKQDIKTKEEALENLVKEKVDEFMKTFENGMIKTKDLIGV